MPRLRYDSTNDYYALLGLPPSASAAEIQQAFHRLAKQIHPDRNPERAAWATERFQALNEAYHVLGDPELRREYDRQRWPHAPYTPEPERKTASADASGSAAPWDYGDWVRHAPPHPPYQPAMTAARPGQMLLGLLRGPFGSIYVVLTLACLTLPLSYLAINQWIERALSASPATEEAPAASCADPALTITTPAQDASVTGQFSVEGRAAVAGLLAYRVELAYLGSMPDAAPPGEWHLVAEHVASTAEAGAAESAGTTAGPRSLVDAIDLAASPAGYYLLRLTAELADGAVPLTCERRFVYRAE